MIVESVQVFGRAVAARRYVERVMAQAIEHELADRHGGSIYGWLLEGVTHEPTKRRIIEAARRLARRLAKAGDR